MQLRRLNGCFGSVVAAWNLVLRVIFPKGDAESSAPGFRERPRTAARQLQITSHNGADNTPSTTEMICVIWLATN
jgi:hypothetical protein